MKLTYREAINKAFVDELRFDSNAVLFGEDDRNNLYGYTEGLLDEFGENRIIDIPLSEAAVVGAACGAALCGIHPIIDLTTENFLYVAMDQIASIAAKTTYIYDGQLTMPIVIFSTCMCNGGNAAQHSDRLHSLFMNIPGLKIICPATPQYMYSMLRAAIKDSNPVLCFADRSLFWMSEEINVNKKISIGNSNLIVQGNDLSIISISGCYKYIDALLPTLYKKGIGADIIDVESIIPLDYKTIQKSVKKTGHVVICDTASRTGSVAEHISSLLVQKSFNYLKSPIEIVSAEDFPVGYAETLEKEVLVSEGKILNAINRVLNHYE